MVSRLILRHAVTALYGETGAGVRDGLRHCGARSARLAWLPLMAMADTVTLRTFMSQEDVHYRGGLVAGARVLGLFGDAGTALLLETDGVEGLLASYEDVQFLLPVRAGDLLDVTATLRSSGRTSRRLEFVAEIGGRTVCTARAVAVAKQFGSEGEG